MTEYVVLTGAMLLTGVVGGIVSGLLGVGGGIVIVPVLELVLSLLGVDPAIRMHVAVGTSLATIVPTSIASSRAHSRRSSVDFALVRRWGIFVFVGAAFGVLIASHVHSRVLSGVFATVALIVALKMMLPFDDRHIAKEVPGGVIASAVPFSIGTISSMMGIGGGTLSVPILTLLAQPIHLAVGTASLLGLLIGIPGALGFIVAGFNHPDLPPGSLGFVNLIGLAVIAPATYIAAPLGARIAHWLQRRHLSIVFGVFLFVVAARMFYSTF
ncbi:MAG: sulfite exporter TauE/SafE family protein [Woeseiaceae bacterium]